MARKSLLWTYVLWFFGGFFGIHHFYLGRDLQALLWWMFAGGYFGVGWVRDLWRIPEYVLDANEEEAYLEKLACKMRTHEKPPSGTVRYCGQILVSETFGYLVLAAWPSGLAGMAMFCANATLPLGVALGVFLVGNIGRHDGSLKSALLGSYLSLPLYLFLQSPVFLTSLLSCWIFNNSLKWRRSPGPRRSLFRRVCCLALCGSVYLALWSSWFYFNCTLSYQNHEVIQCREAARHFFKSPIWKEFLSVVKRIFQYDENRSFEDLWRQIVEAFDPIGERNALRVLGLKATANQKEITSSYRILSRQWHPDKHKNEVEKEIAQERFIEIQQAYEILSKIKSQRLAQNSLNPTMDSSDLEQ